MAPKAKEKPKPSPTPAAQPAIAIEDLFTNLNRHIQDSKNEQAVKVADQILLIAPNDEDAIRCKVVALIKADNVDEALSAIETYKRLPIDFSFFKAYCLYRQNKLNEALELLKVQEGDTAIMLLKSQIMSRLGKMDASLEIYQKLQKSKIDSLEINHAASLISAGRASEVQGMLDSLRVKATSSFELAYNTACSLIERKMYTDAEQLLLSAQRIGTETLMEENMTEEDIEGELAPIAVQLSYVQQLLGNTQKSYESYTEIIKRNLADETSLAIAINNLIPLKGPKDVSDSLKKLDRLIEKGGGPQSFQLAHGLDLKLLQHQKEAIYSNKLLLLLQSNRMDQARELAAAIQEMFPQSIMSVLLQAAVLVRENKSGKAEELLAQYAEKLPENSKPLLLARAQIAAAAGHPQIAAESLSKIPDIQHNPATVATLVSLKERAGDIDSAVSILDSSVQWWSNAMSEDNKLSIIMEEAAAFKLKHGRKEEAARLYEELVKSHGTTDALVGLIKTVAYTDIEKAELYEKKLKPLPGLKSVDVDGLEKTSGAKPGENVVITEPAEHKSKEKGKKKRKRKPRYPKGFDPANPGPLPDPERWLPKRERSSYRPKRKDKRAAQVRGSQGAVVKEMAAANSKAANTKAVVEPATKPSSGKSSKKKSRK
ncbi:signal recognition particle subunit SRP72 [Impatiens glandulifera]|uniref:signal recognition particle subunit SRP72 n=1 Tax=Impatiens glandulifera TaxID=253017 RepID=UPI001FB08A21|nr:signal recognition particle subunit SRP72 [Impatiens glandulifera]